MFVTRKASLGFEDLAASVASALIDLGFDLYAVDGAEESALPSTVKSVVLNATDSIDPFASSQPWSVVITASDNGADDANYLDVAVLPSHQLIDYAAPMYNATTVAGKMCKQQLTTNHFVHLSDVWGLDQDTDFPSHPVQVYAVTTGHGVALSLLPDGLDNQGRAQSWFVVQRLVQTDGVVPLRSPLVCAFSAGGGCVDGNPDVLDVDGSGIFFVREYDLPSVSLARPSGTHTPDGEAIMNFLQQVSFTLDSRFIISCPFTVNSARYVYAMSMDMLNFCSADVLSSQSVLPVAINGGEYSYIALGASGDDNRGVRILFPHH